MFCAASGPVGQLLPSEFARGLKGWHIAMQSVSSGVACLGEHRSGSTVCCDSKHGETGSCSVSLHFLGCRLLQSAFCVTIRKYLLNSRLYVGCFATFMGLLALAIMVLPQPSGVAKWRSCYSLLQVCGILDTVLAISPFGMHCEFGCMVSRLSLSGCMVCSHTSEILVNICL